MSVLKKNKWYENLDSGTLFKFRGLDAYGDIYADETIIDGVLVISEVNLGEIGDFNFKEIPNPTLSKPKRTYEEDERIFDISHKDLEEGKWYFGEFWTVDSCAKYLHNDKSFGYTEKFYDNIYSVYKSISGWSKEIYCEVPIEFLRTFLPAGHPDLNPQTINKQIKSQSNGKTNSSSKQDSESAITVSRKSPKIGEVKRTGASGVHGRRARATIGRYNPQNKAINCR